MTTTSRLSIAGLALTVLLAGMTGCGGYEEDLWLEEVDSQEQAVLPVGVNFLSVVHASSTGITVAFPDVCLTTITVPIPTPYGTVYKTTTKTKVQMHKPDGSEEVNMKAVKAGEHEGTIEMGSTFQLDGSAYGWIEKFPGKHPAGKYTVRLDFNNYTYNLAPMGLPTAQTQISHQIVQ